MIKALLFDLDGVLVDTAKYHFLAWQEIAKSLGIPFSLRDNERLKGVSRLESFNIILSLDNRKMSDKQKQEYLEKKNAAYLEHINKLQAGDLLDGVADFLTEVRKKQYKIALASASKNSQLILEKLNIVQYFDAIVDGNSVTKTKPDPEVFIKCSNLLRVPAEECLVFEDSLAGIQAAHIGRMRVVGIGNKDILSEADLVMPNFINVNMSVLLKNLNA